MNISCQNSAYVGRTHLSQDDTIHKLLQAEIDDLTSNLDLTSNILNSNIIITSNTNYNYTSNVRQELWDVNPNNNNCLIKYKNYRTFDDIDVTFSNINHTYVINSNFKGEIRFSTLASFSSTNDPINDYSVKIDTYGKLYVYHKYNLLQPIFPAGFYDVEGEIFGIKNFALATDTTLSGIAFFQGVVEEQITTSQILILNLQQQIEVLTADLETISYLLDAEMYTLGTATTIPNLAFEFEEIAQTISTVYSANLALARIKSAAIVGVGVAVPLIFASTSDYMNREYFNKIVKNYSNPDLEITEEDRRMLYSCNDEGYFATASNYNYYTTNLTIEQGFINCNIITTQQIPEIFTNKIGIGLAPTNFPLDVVGNINADYYYRSGVKQFVGTSNQHSNLSLSQGFINSNVITEQYIKSLKCDELNLNNSNINNIGTLNATTGIFGSISTTTNTNKSAPSIGLTYILYNIFASSSIV